MENMSNNYATNVKSAIAVNPNFKAICDFNENLYQQGWYETNKLAMANGTGILNNPEQAITYMAAYGTMHQYKLNFAFASLFSKEDFNNKSAEIIDWGCGQAFASCVLIDFIKNNNINLDLSKFTLIEPSAMALQRGLEHIDAIYQRQPKPQTFSINEKADTSLSIKGYQSSRKIKIHLFSNVLDIYSLDLNQVYNNVTSNFDSLNYFVCVSPQNNGCLKIKSFFDMFNNSILINNSTGKTPIRIFRPSEMNYINFGVTNFQYIFKTNL